MTAPDYEALLEQLKGQFKSLEDALTPFIEFTKSGAHADVSKFYEEIANDPKSKELGALLEKFAKHGVPTFEESLRPVADEVARQLREWERQRGIK